MLAQARSAAGSHFFQEVSQPVAKSAPALAVARLTSALCAGQNDWCAAAGEVNGVKSRFAARVCVVVWRWRPVPTSRRTGSQAAAVFWPKKLVAIGDSTCVRLAMIAVAAPSWRTPAQIESRRGDLGGASALPARRWWSATQHTGAHPPSSEQWAPAIANW